MAKHISLIQRSPDIRNRIIGVIERDKLTFTDLQDILKDAEIVVDRAQLSRYLNNKLEHGSIMPEASIIELCRKLKIKVKLLVE